MILKNKLWGFVFLVYAVIVLSSTDAFCLSYPLPPGTKVIREEVAETGGQERTVTFCESDLSADEARNFYLGQMQKMGYSIFMNQPQMAVFKKGEEILLVLISANAEKKTNIILSNAAVDKNAMSGEPAVCEDIPTVAVYPGAQCMGTTRLKTSHTINARYSAQAPMRDVLNFYRSQMRQNGWTLEQELEMGKYLPKQNMPAAAIGPVFNIEDSMQFVFKNFKNERCMITFMPMPQANSVLINIYYEENKQ